MNIYVRKFEVMLISRIIKTGGGVCQFNFFVFLSVFFFWVKGMRLVYNFICLLDFHISTGYVHTCLFSMMGFIIFYWFFYMGFFLLLNLLVIVTYTNILSFHLYIRVSH